MSPDVGAVFPYTSSHRISHVSTSLLFKDLSDAALGDQARISRHDGFHDRRREPEIYRRLLGPLSIGPRCQASGEDWIVIEQIDAPALWQVGHASVWIAVADWTAQMHKTLRAHRATTRRCDLPLVIHDEQLLSTWRARAKEAGVGGEILDAHRRASERLAALPADIIHGELYASNILVRAHWDVDRVRAVDVWPVDWELAGLGPTVLDVAALTMGSGLAATTRTGMERAYFHAADGRPPAWRAWRTDLDAARLHVCVQWLGWSTSWSPPREHRQDWYSQARRLARRF